MLTPQILRVCQHVAADQAGSVADVVRLAVPPRHARAESARRRGRRAVDARLEPSAAWARYSAGPALLRRIADGEGPAASWLALPSVEETLDWPRALADATRTCLAAKRGVIITVPDHRDVERVARQLDDLIGKDAYVRLTADQGPQARYTAWLKALRGEVALRVGNRAAAAFAPVHDLGLMLCWDDGDNLLTEPRAPTRRPATCCGGVTSTAVRRWCSVVSRVRWRCSNGLVEGRVRAVETRPLRALLLAHRGGRRRPRCRTSWSRGSEGAVAGHGVAGRARRASRGRCSSRCPGAGTCCEGVAPSAGTARSAPPATDRCSSPESMMRCTARGATRWRGPSAARSARAPVRAPR